MPILKENRNEIALIYSKKKDIYARAKVFDQANKPPVISNDELNAIVKSVRKKMHQRRP